MEKFGIFNILSALSDMANNKKNAPPSDDSKTAPSGKNQADGFAPPKYNAYSPMLDFIKKHDEISKRIDKNNKP